jgi:thymidylate synthase
MHLKAETLDDLLNKVLNSLLVLPFDNEATRSSEKGPFSEVIGANLEIANPRARLSRSDARGKTFSALGEFLWYLSGSDELSFITYYIPSYTKESTDGHTVYGAYGPRLMSSAGRFNQIENAITQLKVKPGSRRVAIQLFEARDLDPDSRDNIASIPCTCTMQFLLRKEKLNMVTFMRSNDAFLGLPHDIFAFTMLQEYIASAVSVDVGSYIHSVGSLHLYKKDIDAANDYLKEGFHSREAAMMAMPKEDPSVALRLLIAIENKIRNGQEYNIEKSELPSYWKDLAYLLRVFALFRDEKPDLIKEVKGLIEDPYYHQYIEAKISS